jgi:hypothetical protein
MDIHLLSDRLQTGLPYFRKAFKTTKNSKKIMPTTKSSKNPSLPNISLCQPPIAA